MALSRTLFDLKPRSTTDPKELAKKLGQALVDTMDVATEEDRPTVGPMWMTLAKYQHGDISGTDFMAKIRGWFPD